MFSKLVTAGRRSLGVGLLLACVEAVAGCAAPPGTRVEAVPTAVEEGPRRPLSRIAPRLRALIRAGEALWQRPPVEDNTIACATCHFDGVEFEEWATSFPKVRPMPPPFTRVMTLQQAVGESVATHYRIPPGSRNRQVSRAITAYLSWTGEGRPFTPGVAARQPVFPHRMAALRESIARGRAHVERSCAGCHADFARFGEVAATFPRVPRAGAAVMTLEEYLQDHTGPAWDSPEAADIAAFVTARAQGRILQPGGTLQPQQPTEGDSDELAI